MAEDLSDQVVLITGGAKRVGAAICRRLHAQGARLMVHHRSSIAEARALQQELNAQRADTVALIQADLLRNASLPDLVKTVVKQFGRLDILINNATAGGRANDLWRFTEADWDLSFDVNLKGYFAMIRSAAPHLCGQGSGAIVNTSSGSGFGHPSFIAYSSAKEGVVGLTRTVARELGRFGVRCNAIRPLAVGHQATSDYAVNTAKWADLMSLTMGPVPGKAHTTAPDPDNIPARKISPMVVWLCTDAARNVNGRTFHVTGDLISRLSEPIRERVIHHGGGWTLDAIDATAPSHLVDDLTNPYTLDDHPELKVFEE